MKHTNEREYHYFYKITNLLNNYFYYGIHSTDNLDDGYMGSGTRLHKAYERYGIENFKKEILKFFESRDELSDYEASMVNDQLVTDITCYNCIRGGDYGTTYGTATVRYKDGTVYQISCDDPRIKSGELVGVTKGNCNCFDTFTQQYVQIPREEFFSNRHRYKGLVTDSVAVKLKESNYNEFFLISRDEYITNKHLYTTSTSNKLFCKDKKDNYYWVEYDDPRYLAGELVPSWKDKKHTELTKQKMKSTHAKNKHQQGKKNSQYGTCWIMKNEVSKKIRKDELSIYRKAG